MSQSRMAIINHNTGHKIENTHRHSFVIRHFLHHKIAVSQKTSYRDPKLQYWQIVNGDILGCQRFQREERRADWKKRGRRRDRKGWPYVDVSWHLQMPRHYRNFSWAYRKEGWELGPNQIRSLEFSAHQRWPGSVPQLRLRPFNQTSVSSTRTEERRVG